MIEAVFLYYLAEVNECDPNWKTMYPSGVKDADNSPFLSTPKSIYPYLKLDKILIDSKGQIVPPSVYEANIQDNTIVLKQSGEIKGVFLINRMVMLPNIVSIPTVELIQEHKHTTLIYKKDFLQAESAFNQR